MNPYYADDTVRLFAGDCLDVLRELPDASVDSVVTDPPAGIAFMSKSWDTDHGGRDQFVEWLTVRLAECYRVMKPGAHAFVWAMPRTSGWTQRAIEDAGLIPRDCIVHLFGSGFPKSLDVGKAIDKAAGATREVVGRYASPEGTTGPRSRGPGMSGVYGEYSDTDGTGLSAITAPATDAARTWDGWGTALKPASEHWWLARKPLTGTVAANVLTYGTGALNIDACRVGTSGGGGNGLGSHFDRLGDTTPPVRHGDDKRGTAGRWPANVVLDEEMAAVLDEQSGELTSGRLDRAGITAENGIYGQAPRERSGVYEADSGGASRFFFVAPIDQLDTRWLYTAKAGQDERVRLPKAGDSGVGHVAHPT